MEIRSKLWHKFFFWAIPPLLLVLVYFSIGFYYENNDDVSRDYALRNPEHPILDFIVWIPIISDFLRRFYMLDPAFPFYSVFIYGMLLTSIYIIASFFFNRNTSEYNQMSWFFFLLIFIGAISENVMYLTYTRVAIILCGSIILKLIFSENLSRSQVIILGLLLLIASFIRLSCLNLCVLILAPAILIKYSQEGKSLLFRLSIIIAIFFISISFQIRETSQELDQITAIQKIHDFKYIDHDKIKDERGMLLLEAVYKWFYADTKIINADVLDDMLKDYSVGNIKADFKGDTFYFIGLVLRNYFFLLFVGLVLLIFFYKTLPKKKFLLLVCYYIYFWVMISFISLVLKSEERIIGPSILLFTIALLALVDVLSLFQWTTRQKVFQISLLLFLGLTVYKIKGRVDFNIAKRVKNETTLNVINDFSKGKVIMITSLGSHISFLDPFMYYPMYMGDTMVRLSGGLSFLPENQKMIKNIVGSESVLNLFQKASANDKIVLIATEDETDFIKRFFHFFYNAEFQFRPIENDKFQNEQLKAFVVSQ